MKKMAIYVEGQTELLFVAKLLIEIAGAKNIAIQQERRISKNKFRFIHASSNGSNKKYFVLIRDCMNDASVKSEIIDACENLQKAGHEKVVGLRDVYPSDRNHISDIEGKLYFGVPTKYIPIHLFLSVMEIEAWFLAETSHFLKIHPSLTIELIKINLKFDPSTDDAEARDHPSKDLNDIYHLAGLTNQCNK